MPVNLEVKARIQSVEGAEKIAQAIQAQFTQKMKQLDTYFIVQHGRLKLREIDEDIAELISYQRGEDSNQRLSDFHIYPVSTPEQLRGMLATVLGIKVQVAKTRILYLYEGTRIHIDEVKGLGIFLEFEVPVRDSEHVARERLNFLIQRFGINEADFIKESYSDMLLRV